jgi:ubiquinone/menaquinone biosynthesis C-methylase UbiE
MSTTLDAAAIKEREHANWSSAAPAWMRYDAPLTRKTEPVSLAMIRHAGIRPGMRVLDLASGTGEPALRIAATVGSSGSVLATDFSDAMLAFAREKAAAAGLHNVEFRRVDAETIAVEPASFDAVTCRWGIMFMPSPVDALRAARAALRKGGRISLATWASPQDNPFLSLCMPVLRKHVEIPTPPPEAPGLFAFADSARLVSTLEQAGFNNAAVEPVTLAFTFPDGAAYWAFQRDVAAPIARIYQALPESTREQVDADVIASAERFRDGDRLSIPGLAWVAWGSA